MRMSEERKNPFENEEALKKERWETTHSCGNISVHPNYKEAQDALENGVEFEEEPAETDGIYSQLIISLNQVVSRFDTRISNLMRGMSQSQVKIICYLRKGPSSQKTLKVFLGCSGSNITSLLDVLEAKQLVSKDRSTEDRRFVNVKLTEKGERYSHSLAVSKSRLFEASFESLKSAELLKLDELLNKILENLLL